MIICSCFGITDQDILDGNAGEAGTDCGSCKEMVEDMLEKTKKNSVFEASPQAKTIYKNDYDNLKVCMDTLTDDIYDTKQWSVVIHHSIPSEEDYRHIGLNREQAKSLYKWLGKYLEKTE